MLLKVKHSKTLPHKLTPHQMVDVCEEMHDHITDVVTPLVDANPQFQAIALTLVQLKDATSQLQTVLDTRKYKSARNLRGVGGADGLSGDPAITDELTLSKRKRNAHANRASLMKRFRFTLSWKLGDAQQADNPQMLAAARQVGRLLDRRMKDFERLTYEESATEFGLFFRSIDNDAATQAALATLDLDNVYASIVAAHTEFKLVHREQTQIDSNREELPTIKAASNELRRIVRFLLSLLHHDVASGSPAFNSVLGHVDEMIDKVRAVSKRRDTLDKQAKDAKDATDANDDKDAQDAQNAKAEKPVQDEPEQTEAESSTADAYSDETTTDATGESQAASTSSDSGSPAGTSG